MTALNGQQHHSDRNRALGPDKTESQELAEQFRAALLPILRDPATLPVTRRSLTTFVRFAERKYHLRRAEIPFADEEEERPLDGHASQGVDSQA